MAGGDAWLVGGCVRDLSLGILPKDWDVEAFGLEPEVLWQLLSRLGYVEQVGRLFGVTKLWLDGLEIDVALPRTEQKTAAGHRGFTVNADPFISPERAVLRRDFTVNAMMFDPLEETMLDYHNGLDDLKQGVLRHVSTAFMEDPLRPLRAMQFAARFKMVLAEETSVLCRGLLAEAKSLPDSRIWHEWLKWSQSDYPSYGLRALRDMGWLKLYPELEALIGCKQDGRWHPEGDVWTHTCLVSDEAARLKRERKLNSKDQQVLMFAALCHDLGKPVVTYVNDNGLVLAPKHAQAGLNPCLSFLQGIGAPAWLQKRVLLLVAEQGAHFSGEATADNVAWLAHRLDVVSINLWEVLTEADASGCSPMPPTRPALQWLEQARSLGAESCRLKPIVTGKLLIKWGFESSKHMGSLLKQTYAAQLNGLFNDEKAAYSWVKKYHIASGKE